MKTYEARDYYQDAGVAERYHEQFVRVRGLSDLMARVHGQLEERAFRSLLARVPRGGNVLDVACGTGRYVRGLVHAGFRVVGADVSAEMLAVARRATEPGPRLLRFEQADAARLPFPDRHFDGVTCMRLYHRVPPNLRSRMLREVRRVGRGWAILSFGMTSPWLAARRALRGAFGGRPTDPHPVTLDELRLELAAAGLEMGDRRRVIPGLADGLIVQALW